MRRLFTALLAAIVAIATPVATFADTRIVVYGQQNPLDTQQNSNARFERVTVGSLMSDGFGAASAAAGTYANLTCAPGSGLQITVAPTLANSAGGVYQQMQNDPNPLPSGYVAPSPLPTSLPADPTVVMVRGNQQGTTAPFGPLTAPGGGLKTYYLLEAALASQDGNPQSLRFITNTGVSFFQTVNTNRNDVIVWTLKGGTPAASPTPLPVDAGNVAICDTLIPNGKTQVLTGDITMRPAFTGWMALGSAILLSPTASPTPQAGNAAIAGQFAANQLVSTVATGTPPFIVSSTTVVPNLQSATALQLTNAPVGTSPITVSGSTSLTIACGTCLTGVTAGTNLVVSGSSTNPTVATTAAPSFTNLTVASGVTFSGLLSGCLQTNGSGVVSITSCSASAVAYNATTPLVLATPPGSVTYSCPTCVTSVAAGNNMVVSPSGGPTPTVSVTNAPTFVGTVTAGTVVAGGTLPTGLPAGYLASGTSAIGGFVSFGNGTAGQQAAIGNDNVTANTIKFYPVGNATNVAALSSTAFSITPQIIGLNGVSPGQGGATNAGTLYGMPGVPAFSATQGSLALTQAAVGGEIYVRSGSQWYQLNGESGTYTCGLSAAISCTQAITFATAFPSGLSVVCQLTPTDSLTNQYAPVAVGVSTFGFTATVHVNGSTTGTAAGSYNCKIPGA